MPSTAFRFQLLVIFCLVKIFSDNGLWLCPLTISISVSIRLFNFTKHLVLTRFDGPRPTFKIMY